jgi:hypothetical protein
MVGDLNGGEHFAGLGEDGTIILEQILEYKCECTD